MDTSVGGLLSEMAKMVEEDLGSETVTKALAEEFGDNGPYNPLNNLQDRDKTRLIALMVMHEYFRDNGSPIIEINERIARLTADAGKLADQIEYELREDSILEVLKPLEEFCKDLQFRLSIFSTQVGKFLDLIGKRGHKQKNLSNCFLIAASEFIRLKTGTHNDEHLAELFQGRSDIPESRELSGDAIRKKREYLQKRYPNLYDVAVETAKGMRG